MNIKVFRRGIGREIERLGMMKKGSRRRSIMLTDRNGMRTVHQSWMNVYRIKSGSSNEIRWLSSAGGGLFSLNSPSR